MGRKLSGVIAAIATPIDAAREPDLGRFVRLANHLLHNGCDGLNVLGTTGEATSFSVGQRMRVMTAAAEGADVSRMMAGAGASALEDAIALTRHAARLGFAGALILPPFYYIGVPDEGVLAYFAAIVEATAGPAIPLYLYHYPALSGVPFTPSLVEKLLDRFPGRIAGLKDSSGDMAYARGLAQAHPMLAVFPSTEAALLEARTGAFAGCISATCNLNSGASARAFHAGDTAEHARAVAIRTLFDGKPLVAGIKAGLAHLHGDLAFAEAMPPLVAWPAAERAALAQALSALGEVPSRPR
jgi:4-hydroxy-tetrahydrodipicolinate synthase